MEYRRLRRCRKRLVHAHDNRIRTENGRIVRECLIQSKMRAMRLVHNQWNSVRMCQIRNRPNIRHKSVICWRSDHDCLNIRLFNKLPLHICCLDLSLDSVMCRNRIHILCLKSTQIDGVVDGLVTVARHQNSAAFRCRGTDCCEDATRTSIHEIIRLP